MTKAVTTEFRPDWISPPGDTIEDILAERGWSQAEFAARTGFTKKHVNDLVKGRTAITPDAAMRLEMVLDASAEFWLRRESRYQEALERRRTHETLEKQSIWLEELPIKAMTKFGWIPSLSTPAGRVEACLHFFGVASIAAWREQYEKPVAALRASDKFEVKTGCVAAWLRASERQAARIDCKPFHRAVFKSSLEKARQLTGETRPEAFIPALQSSCAEAGVAVVFVPTPDGCPVSGAAQWMAPERGLIMLSLRHKTNDQLWFTFFHEAGHLLLHGKKLLFIDVGDCFSGDAEEEANAFSRNTLIPPRFAAGLSSRGLRKDVVVNIAKLAGVAPGIIVGRMQHEGIVPWTHLNGLKVRYSWVSRRE
jgi:addiction module HigA family antidote